VEYAGQRAQQGHESATSASDPGRPDGAPAGSGGAGAALMVELTWNMPVNAPALA
jgi:hypothetical protein